MKRSRISEEEEEFGSIIRSAHSLKQSISLKPQSDRSNERHQSVDPQGATAVSDQSIESIQSIESQPEVRVEPQSDSIESIESNAINLDLIDLHIQRH